MLPVFSFFCLQTFFWLNKKKKNSFLGAQGFVFPPSKILNFGQKSKEDKGLEWHRIRPHRLLDFAHCRVFRQDLGKLWNLIFYRSGQISTLRPTSENSRIPKCCLLNTEEEVAVSGCIWRLLAHQLFCLRCWLGLPVCGVAPRYLVCPQIFFLFKQEKNSFWCTGWGHCLSTFKKYWILAKNPKKTRYWNTIASVRIGCWFCTLTFAN